MIRSWSIGLSLLIICVGAGLFMVFGPYGERPMDERVTTPNAIRFSDIAGWESDNHSEAFSAFRRSCERIIKIDQARAETGGGAESQHKLNAVCQAVLAMSDTVEKTVAREFFEKHFTPHRFPGDGMQGFVTGYYEPELKGSLNASEQYSVPVYSVPDDLVQLFPDSERAKRNHEMTAGRKTGDGMVPYYDRKEIESGALTGRGLEILYLSDWADAFYMHVQGSGRVALEEGGYVRLSYAAKNGHSYTAIGKHLIERGAITRDEMSMEAVRNWLDANGQEARELMWENRSYIFFRELPAQQAASGPIGSQGVALTPRRSLAVDTSLHAFGTPIWVNAPELEVDGGTGFSQLMISQDAGSAIKGEQRGDIYFGSGSDAGDIAGGTRHQAEFILLVPNAGSSGG
jgi:membrane-bound lytic murein transglycosylase A